mgnify:CR=1 FL=1
MRYFNISEFDSPDEKGSGKNMSPLFLDFIVGHALQLVHELGLPFRVGIAGKSKGNFCHIDIDEEKTNPRLWIY